MTYIGANFPSIFKILEPSPISILTSQSVWLYGHEESSNLAKYCATLLKAM